MAGSQPSDLSFIKYLESLPAATLNRLWVDTRTAVAILRQLPSVAQYTVQRLLLVNGAIPFDALRSWHPTSFKATQNSSLLTLKHLQILQGRSGEVWLNEEFRAALLRAFSGDLEMNGSLGGGDEPSAYGEQRWESILYDLVTGANLRQRKGHFTEVLIGAGLISSDALVITSVGFQFLLAERHSQLWTLLIQYFLMMEASGMDVVSCILSICRLSLMPPGSLVTGLLPGETIEFLLDVGLIKESRSGHHTARGSEYVATDLTKQLARSRTTPSSQAGYIVIETNYKVYGYTSSPLLIAILGLFVRLKDRFSNMVQGQLTGPSVQAALSKGISASQLITYLEQHLHPTMRVAGLGLSSVISDQIHLWERDRNRLRYVEGYLYQEFMTDDPFRRTVSEAQRLNSALYVNYQKRLVVVKEEAHPSIKAFIKSESQ